MASMMGDAGMRNNQPVTQHEIKMGQDDILVSRTDLKGRIIYANRAFCEIAGFTEDELRGKAHNIVRHPDMHRYLHRSLSKYYHSQMLKKRFVIQTLGYHIGTVS